MVFSIGSIEAVRLLDVFWYSHMALMLHHNTWIVFLLELLRYVEGEYTNVSYGGEFKY